MNVLVLNAGSSSQKCSLYSLPDSSDELPDEPLEPVWEGSIDFGHHEGKSEITVQTSSGESFSETMLNCDRSKALRRLLETLWAGPTSVIKTKEEIVAVGHRVVHGGEKYHEAVLVDDAVKAAIRELTPLAPAHNPANLTGIEIAQALFGKDCCQFVVFDTAFHHTLPKAAATYPVPQSWVEKRHSTLWLSRY